MNTHDDVELPMSSLSCRSKWSELKIHGIKPKARYGHCMCRVDSRVLMFGGENNTSLANDLWTLRGLGLDGEEAPAWIPLELPGNAPAPRKGHSCTCEWFWSPSCDMVWSEVV